MYSLLDYYCFSYLCCHLDGLAKNLLMVTYDGVIWGASLYDMDSTYGAQFDGSFNISSNFQCPEQYQETNSLLWQRIEKCFRYELHDRYFELRRNALSLSNIINHVERIFDMIPDRVFNDEHSKWTNLPSVPANTMTRFRNYMRDRVRYVDAEFTQLTADRSVVAISLDSKEKTLSLSTGSTSDTIIPVDLHSDSPLYGLDKTTGEIVNGDSYVTNTMNLDAGWYSFENNDDYLFVCVLNDDETMIEKKYGDDSGICFVRLEQSQNIRCHAHSNSGVCNLAIKKIATMPLYKNNMCINQHGLIRHSPHSSDSAQGFYEIKDSKTITITNAKYWQLAYYDRHLQFLGISSEQEQPGTTTVSDDAVYVAIKDGGGYYDDIILRDGDGVVLQKATIDYASGGAQTVIKATLTPDYADDKNVTWSTDDATGKYATISPDGLSCLVDAVSVGTVVVTCTSHDTTNGIISDSCVVTIEQ